MFHPYLYWICLDSLSYNISHSYLGCFFFYGWSIRQQPNNLFFLTKLNSWPRHNSPSRRTLSTRDPAQQHAANPSVSSGKQPTVLTLLLSLTHSVVVVLLLGLLAPVHPPLTSGPTPPSPPAASAASSGGLHLAGGGMSGFLVSARGLELSKASKRASCAREMIRLAYELSWFG